MIVGVQELHKVPVIILNHDVSKDKIMQHPCSKLCFLQINSHSLISPNAIRVSSNINRVVRRLHGLTLPYLESEVKQYCFFIVFAAKSQTTFFIPEYLTQSGIFLIIRSPTSISIVLFSGLF